MNILIKENRPLTALGIKTIIKSVLKTEKIELTNDKKTTIEKIQFDDYHFLILDSDFNYSDIRKILKFIKYRASGCKVLINESKNMKSNKFDLIKMGVSGYLSYNADLEEITLALNLINSGMVYLSQQDITLNDKYIDSKDLIEDRLSSREFMVFKFLISGLGVNDISKELDLKQTTISTLKRRVFLKLETKNLVELYNLAQIYGYK